MTAIQLVGRAGLNDICLARPVYVLAQNDLKKHSKQASMSRLNDVKSPPLGGIILCLYHHKSSVLGCEAGLFWINRSFSPVELLCRHLRAVLIPQLFLAPDLASLADTRKKAEIIPLLVNNSTPLKQQTKDIDLCIFSPYGLGCPLFPFLRDPLRIFEV